MPILDGTEQERQGVLETANLMVVAARTAPKSGGVDDLFTAVVVGQEIGFLADDMEKMGAERNVKEWGQQAREVRNSDAIVLIGVRGTKTIYHELRSMRLRILYRVRESRKETWPGLSGTDMPL